MSKLSAGDVVVIKEGGWGFLPSDENKVVLLLSYSDLYGEREWTVKPFNCKLNTEYQGVGLDNVREESFGKNPLLLHKINLELDLEKPIKSDGGSSSYYDINLPNWLVEEIYSRYEKGQGFIKTEELIEVAFKNDFDFGTTFKALVRGFGSLNGGGKEGNDVEYEMNKVGYYSNRVKQRTSR